MTVTFCLYPFHIMLEVLRHATMRLGEMLYDIKEDMEYYAGSGEYARGWPCRGGGSETARVSVASNSAKNHEQR